MCASRMARKQMYFIYRSPLISHPRTVSRVCYTDNLAEAFEPFAGIVGTFFPVPNYKNRPIGF